MTAELSPEEKGVTINDTEVSTPVSAGAGQTTPLDKVPFFRRTLFQILVVGICSFVSLAHIILNAIGPS